MRLLRLLLPAILLAALRSPVVHAAFGDHQLFDDPYYGAQWPLENTGQAWPLGCTPGTTCIPTTPDADIDWGSAWDAGFSGQGVTVAIGTPTGAPTLWCDDADLAARIVPGWNFAAGTAQACRTTPPATGTEWHDTIVARLAVGEGNNSFAGVGAAPAAQLMPIVWAQDSQNRVFYEQVLPFLASNGVRVIVVPYTGVSVTIDGGETAAQACSDVADDFGLNRASILAASSVLVLWGQPQPTTPPPPDGPPDGHYPTCDPSSLGVAHTNQNDASLASSPYVDIAAPGSRPEGTSISTSWALGIFAGAVALLLDEQPSLTRAGLVARLLSSAEQIPPGPYPNPQYGAGRLNVFRALLLGDADGDGVPGDGNGSGVAGDFPCAGTAVGCDDNCGLEPNAGQADGGGPGGAGAPDGIGNACQCGDLTGEGFVTAVDVLLAREFLAGIPNGAAATRCNVVGPPGIDAESCQLDDSVVLARVLAGRPPALQQICAPALP